MNKGELRTYAYDFLKSNSQQGPWQPAEMDRYAQDGHMKMHQMVCDTFEDFFSVVASPDLSETASVDLIDLPTDLYRILRLERISGGMATPTNPVFMTKIDRTQSDIVARRYYPYWYVTDGRSAFPLFYYAIGQKQIRLLPIPASTLANSLRLTYIFRPAALVNDTDVPFQQTVGTGGTGKDNLTEFHEIIALYVIEKCLLTPGEENIPLAQEVRGMRQERELELKSYLSRINLQAPRSMEITEGVTDYD